MEASTWRGFHSHVVPCLQGHVLKPEQTLSPHLAVKFLVSSRVRMMTCRVLTRRVTAFLRMLACRAQFSVAIKPDITRAYDNGRIDRGVRRLVGSIDF